MSAIFHVQSVLFDPSVVEEERKKWLSENNYKAKFGNTRTEKIQDGLVAYKQFNSGKKHQTKVPLDENGKIWGVCELVNVKHKQKKRVCAVPAEAAAAATESEKTE